MADRHRPAATGLFTTPRFSLNLGPMRKACLRFSDSLRAALRAVAIALILTAPLAAYANEAFRPPALDRDAGGEVVMRALALLGTPYRYGGDSPEGGFDCSGLVRHVFRDAAGFTLPRRSQEMSSRGDEVARAELLPGDLVFFNTLRSAFSHVGIYVGDNRFVHAPTSGGVVRVESIEVDYWSRRFDGARRLAAAGGGATPWVPDPNVPPLDAQASLRAQGAILRAHFLH